MELSTPLLLREPPRSRTLGLIVSIGSVALCTAAIYPLKAIAPDVSLGVVYLIAVIGVSIFWGFGMGLFTAVLSAAAFNFFHIPPTGQFTIQDSENWVALAAFLVAAAFVSTLAELGRARSEEAELRRREADLMAELARILLGRPSIDAALPVAAERIATALELPSASLQLGEAAEYPGRLTIPLSRGESRVGTLSPPGRDRSGVPRTRARNGSCPASRPCWQPRSIARHSFGRPSRPRRCVAATTSRPLSCEPSPTICGPRSPPSGRPPRPSAPRPSRRPIGGSSATRSSWTRTGWRRWSTTCSISRGCGRGRRSPPGTGPRSRR